MNPALFASLLLLGTFPAQAVAQADLTKPDPAAIERWQAMRFGMFIHWGPVSLTGREIGWSRGQQTPIAKYDNLYKEFNPTKFDADEWVAVAKAAGMKYIVLTTKHHDGFCLWDTKLTDYNIMHTPFKRDVVKELAQACKNKGVAFGAYYSVTDWYDPNWPVGSPAGTTKHELPRMDAYEKYLRGQITELIENYGPLVTIWNDMPEMYGKARGRRTIELVRKLQPDILINDRTGDGGDYSTPEQAIGGFNLTRPWESCMTVSAHNRWAWGGENDGVKPVRACLEMLIRGSGGDGNVLLNVGPRPDGMIDPAQASLLKEVGDWLARNGESIYGTRGGPFKPGRWGVSTRNNNHIYLHVLHWSGDTLTLPPIGKKISSGKLLSGGDVTIEQSGNAIRVAVAKKDRHVIDTLIELTLEGSAMDIVPVAVTE